MSKNFAYFFYTLLRLIFSCLFLGVFFYQGNSQNFRSSEFIGKKYSIQSQWLDSVVQPISENEMEKILSILKQLEDISIHENDADFKTLVECKKIKYTFIDTKDSLAAENRFIQLLAEVKNRKNNILIAHVSQEFANFYWEIKSFSKSLELYLNAFDEYKNLPIHEFPNKAEYLYAIGSKYYYFKDYNTAKFYFKEVWNKIPYGNISNRASKMNSLAMCYRNMAEYDSSLYYFQQAEQIAKKDTVELWLGIISGNLGFVYMKLNMLDTALSLFRKNIEISRKHRLMEDLAISLSSYGSIIIQKKNPSEGMPYIREALDIIYERHLNNSRPVVSRIYPYIATVMAANNHYKEAYNYLDSAYNAFQEVEKQKNMMYISGVQHKIDVEKHKTEMERKEKEITIEKWYSRAITSGAVILLLFAGIFWVQRNQISKAKKTSDEQKQRSDELLLNILPEEVAEELKNHGITQAKHFENITVIFTDFVNFTQLSETMSPNQLIEEIHECFSAFDHIMEKHHLEKIKTIGDAYMAAGGLPTPNNTHASDAIKAAKEMCDFIEKGKIRKIKANQPYFEMRVGIHTGPVVAGIVGVKKFQYDIWGDTVNTAARMESSAEAGKINISQATYELVKDEFTFEYRGEIDAKGKGKVKMYFVS